MNVMRGVLAGLVLLGAQPAFVAAGAQAAGPQVVAAANGDLAGKGKASKASAGASAKGAKSSLAGKSKRSAPAIIAAPSTAGKSPARLDPVQTDKLPAAPPHGAARARKPGRP